MTESERLALAGLSTLPLIGSLGCPVAETCAEERANVELPGELPDNGTNPTLLEARWLANDLLELQFSEPLEALDPTDPIAPARFRVMGWTIDASTYYDCTLYTNYYPVRQGGNFPAELWQAPEDAAVLRLRMNAPVTCANPDDPLAGLALFYTNDPLTIGNASVRDADGNQLPDIGPSWALNAMVSCAANYGGGSSGYGYYYYGPYCSGLANRFTGSFPVLPNILDIPCPGT